MKSWVGNLQSVAQIRRHRVSGTPVLRAPARARADVERLLAEGKPNGKFILDVPFVEKSDRSDLESYLICKWADLGLVPETVAVKSGVRQRAILHLESFASGHFPGIIYLRSRGANMDDPPRLAALNLIIGKSEFRCGLDLHAPTRRRLYDIGQKGTGDSACNPVVGYFSGLPIPPHVQVELRGLARNLKHPSVLKSLAVALGNETASRLRDRAIRLSMLDLFPSSL